MFIFVSSHCELAVLRFCAGLNLGGKLAIIETHSMLSQLQLLRADDCLFSGTLPDSWGNLSSVSSQHADLHLTHIAVLIENI